MGWPYAFLTDLSDDAKAQRRESLSHYASIAHYYSFFPAALFLLIRLVLLVKSRVERKRRGRYSSIPGSPIAKAQRLTNLGDLKAKWTRLIWWLGEDVFVLGESWGQRDEWILGSAYFLWLLTLSIVGTGNDYLHLTKRLGLIAASQFPLHYLLTLKSFSPLSSIFLTSHEALNRYHRVLGRIIYTLLSLHIILYNWFFIATGIWFKRFFAPVVFVGVLASLLLHALSGTAMRRVRNWSYRVFFVTHLAGALGIPALIFWHAPSARLYLVEALAFFLLDLAVRRLRTIPASSTIEGISGTNLLKITATIPQRKMGKFKGQPGSHIYLSLPPSSRPSAESFTSKMSWEFMFNPFTVSSINTQSNTLTLVARNRAGPLTNHLHALSGSQHKHTLNIEGPYGAAGKSLKTLLDGGFDRILLLAGGIGATFTLPIYHAILSSDASARVKIIWAIRAASEGMWATTATGRSILNDDGIELFLTGDMGVDSPSSEGVELPQGGNRKRPDVGRIVDETFRLGAEESVAVLVCGPEEMNREVRTRVAEWVDRGRRVWWHSEAFGW